MHLQALTELQNLSIRRARLTDAGLEQIRRLKNVKSLNLAGNKDLTSEGISDLKRALPACSSLQYSRQD